MQAPAPLPRNALAGSESKDDSMNWSELLSRANIPEPPGYKQTVAKVLARPKRPKRKKKKR